MLWLRNQETITKIDFVNHSERKWKTSRNRRILKVVGSDGIETCRARQDETSRVIKFGNQIEHAEEQIGHASWESSTITSL